MKSKIRKIILTIVVMFSIIINSAPVEADVGSFESYDSGSSYSSSSSDDSDIGITLWVLFIILAIIVYVLNKKDTNSRKGPLHKTVRNIGPDLEREKQVENQLKQIKTYYGSDESTYKSALKTYFGVETEDEAKELLSLEYKRG